MFVLVDNTETDVFQIDDKQNMKIPLSPNTEKVEIISSHVLVLHTYSSIYGEFCKILDTGKHLKPHEQIKTGFLVKDVICRDNFNLIFHGVTNKPACVTPGNVEKFYERGYVTENIFSLPFSEIYKLDDSTIRYSIYDAVLQNIELDGQTVRFHVDAENPGMLSVLIPREIMMNEDPADPIKLNYQDCNSGSYSHSFISTHLLYLKTFQGNAKQIEFSCK